MMMIKKLVLSTGALLLILSVNAQELLTPLTVLGPLAADARARQSAPVTVQDTIALPSNGFRDNFMYDSHRPDTVMWDLSLNPGVYVNRGWASSPINLGVCTFDGLNWAGQPYDMLSSVNASMPCDELTSRHFSLMNYDPSDSVMISFWWEAQGRGYAPNQVDSLLLQVNIPAWNTAGEVWKTVWFMEGYNPQGSDTSFHLAQFMLDSASYFTQGFRFRFKNWASGCGSNDHWHIDEVKFKPFSTLMDTVMPEGQFFVYDMPSLLKDYHQVPGPHYAAAQNSLMTPASGVVQRNTEDAIANVKYYFQIFDPGNPTALFTYSGGNNGTFQPHSYSTWPQHTNFTFGYTYTPLLAPDTGYYIVEHNLIDNNGDTASVPYYQRFYNQYAYDDGTAEVGYGIFGAGALLAYRFDMPVGVTDTLTSVQMYFLPVLDVDNLMLREFRLTVWNHNAATNGPGQIVYQQSRENPGYSPDAPNRFMNYTIDSGIVVVSGTFYVGWQQEATDRLYIGMDFENNQQSKIYFNTSGVWNTSVYEGSLMMRPVFGEIYTTGTGEHTPATSLSVFPNPATEQITIAGLEPNQQYTAGIIDISGRTVAAQQVSNGASTMDVSTLAPGVYVLSVMDEAGIRRGVQRIVVE
jgi:hypothetical protein